MWEFVWDLVREVMWEGYVIDPESRLQIRTTRINKMLTKILKLSISVQVFFASFNHDLA